MALDSRLNELEKAMMDSDADAYRVNLSQFGADFDEIATAVEQYGGVPTGEAQRSVLISPSLSRW